MTDQTTLATKTCVPCKGGVPRLDRRQAEDLIDGIEAWELNDDATRISRTFKFPNFVEALALAARIADLAESQFHHPRSPSVGVIAGSSSRPEKFAACTRTTSSWPPR